MNEASWEIIWRGARASVSVTEEKLERSAILFTRTAHHWPTQGKLKPVRPIAWHQEGLTLVLNAVEQDPGAPGP